MKLIEIIAQSRRDFQGKYECEFCGHIDTDKNLDSYDDSSLADVMTNLGGHDIETLIEAFNEADDSEQPQCFIAYTVKGKGLPLAGHKDNHAGLMSVDQMAEFKKTQGVPDGAEWDKFGGIEKEGQNLQYFIDNCDYQKRAKIKKSVASIKIPAIFKKSRRVIKS